jgi:hypothetical protein
VVYVCRLGCTPAPRIVWNTSTARFGCPHTPQ